MPRSRPHQIAPPTSLAALPTTIDPDSLQAEELRGGWLGFPRAFQIIDLMGMSLGAWMAYMGWRDRGQWQGLVSIGLGAVMMFIHSQRFAYAPQSASGLEQLAKNLNLTQRDLARISAELAP